MYQKLVHWVCCCHFQLHGVQTANEVSIQDRHLYEHQHSAKQKT